MLRAGISVLVKGSQSLQYWKKFQAQMELKGQCRPLNVLVRQLESCGRRLSMCEPLLLNVSESFWGHFENVLKLVLLIVKAKVVPSWVVGPVSYQQAIPEHIVLSHSILH